MSFVLLALFPFVAYLSYRFGLSRRFVKKAPKVPKKPTDPISLLLWNNYAFCRDLEFQYRKAATYYEEERPFVNYTGKTITSIRITHNDRACYIIRARSGVYVNSLYFTAAELFCVERSISKMDYYIQIDLSNKNWLNKLSSLIHKWKNNEILDPNIAKPILPENPPPVVEEIQPFEPLDLESLEPIIQSLDKLSSPLPHQKQTQ